MEKNFHLLLTEVLTNRSHKWEAGLSLQPGGEQLHLDRQFKEIFEELQDLTGKSSIKETELEDLGRHVHLWPRSCYLTWYRK